MVYTSSAHCNRGHLPSIPVPIEEIDANAGSFSLRMSASDAGIRILIGSLSSFQIVKPTKLNIKWGIQR